MALSLWCTAWSLRVWLFCSSATIRKVMIVVAVLMISCHVSTSRSTRTLGAQITMRRTQKAKKAARPTISEANPAKRSKTPTRVDTSVGISTWRSSCPIVTPRLSAAADGSFELGLVHLGAARDVALLGLVVELGLGPP